MGWRKINASGAEVVQGSQGPTGPTGPTGANGTNGTNGATGPTGPTGPAGASGGGAVSLLYSATGTSAATGATTVDSYALASQLAANDTLMILITMESNGATTSAPGMKNSTDSVNFATNSITSNTDESYVAYLRAAQSSTKRIDYWQHGYQSTTQIPDVKSRMAFTTDWTGAWTIALGYSSLGAGGTFTWRWSIYRITG
jgi:hypothetical protein